MNCQHCNAEVEWRNACIAWCQSCINTDWDLLVKAGAITPLCDKKKYSYPVFYWEDDVAYPVLTISPITMKTLPVLPELPKEAKSEIVETVSSSFLCKRLYYGIQCSCNNCGVDVVSSANQNFNLCKMRYYGLPCNCGDCPPERKRYKYR